MVLQEAFGVSAHIEDVCRRFAAAGWLAAAPQLFHRTGGPALSYDDLPAAREHMSALQADDLLEDVDASLKHLADAGIAMSSAAVVGFCMGGSVALAAAARRPLAAAVSFYGGGVREGRFGFPPLRELAPQLQTPWLGLYGDEDQSIPVADVEQLRAAAAQAPVPTEIVRYPGAGHGFHCDDRPDHFRPDAARDAWARTLDWLGRAATPPGG